MKNLKKVLALVVVFSMMLSTVAFAAFPDVNEDADYANAVNTIAALGIVGGDDQGNFNPDNTITRAEFTKILCEAQAIKGDAAKGATIFTDVAADHWASGYINMAVGQKIINGMGDGTFAPESPVTYEQAIKMIVVALGYEPMAADKGGYPTGYMVVAQSIGLTKGVAAPAQTDAAKRSLVAELIYNALDVPMMEQVGFGAEKSYEIKDGKGDKERVTLLTSKFDVVKLGGVVIANDKVTLESIVLEEETIESGKAKEGEIVLAYDNNYKSTNDAFELGGDEDDAKKVTAKVGDTDAADLVGQRVVAFLQEDGKGYEVLAIVAEDGANNAIEINLADVVAIDADEISYYESDDAKKATDLELDSAAILWNNTNDEWAVSDIADAMEEGKSATLTLIDWNDDEAYDLIKVEEYAHFVVEEIDEDTFTVATMEGDDFILDAEEVEYAITIKNAKGEALAFSDIAVGDVLAVISSDIADPSTPADDGFIDITVLGQSSIEGIVKSVDTNSALDKYTINGEVYKVDAAFDDIDGSAIGAEGIFYIGINGQIVAFDGSKAANGNYGILIKTAAPAVDGWDDEWQVKILNKDGEAIIYDVADTFKFNDVAADPADELDAFTTAATIDNVADRMIQYKVNSANEIKAITVIAAEADDTDAEYNATSKKLTGLGKVDASTVIFKIDATDVEDSKIVTVDSLLDEVVYTVAVYEKEDTVYEAVMILAGDSVLADVAGWAVATSVADTTDEDGAEAKEISFVENGEKEVKKILVTDDTDVDIEYNAETDAVALADTMAAGSLFAYAADAEGNATAIALFANITDGAFDYSVLKDGIDATYGTASKPVTFAEVLNTGKIADLEFNGEIIVGDTNEYRFNNERAARPSIEVGSVKGGDVANIRDGATEGNLFFARLVDGEVVDVISINNKVSLADVIDLADIDVANFGDGANEAGVAIAAEYVAYNTIKVTLTAENVDEHYNEAETPALGHWIGFKVDAPAGATSYVATFGDDDYEADAEFIAFYVDALDEDVKTTATLTWLDGDGDEVTQEVNFIIDATGVVDAE